MSYSINIFQTYSLYFSMQCQICNGNFDAKNNFGDIKQLRTKCQHRFHTGCLIRHMSVTNKCFVCDKEDTFFFKFVIEKMFFGKELIYKTSKPVIRLGTLLNANNILRAKEFVFLYNGEIIDKDDHFELKAQRRSDMYFVANNCGDIIKVIDIRKISESKDIHLLSHKSFEKLRDLIFGDNYKIEESDEVVILFPENTNKKGWIIKKMEHGCIVQLENPVLFGNIMYASRYIYFSNLGKILCLPLKYQNLSLNITGYHFEDNFNRFLKDGINETVTGFQYITDFAVIIEKDKFEIKLI